MAGRGAPKNPNSIRAKDHKDIVETTKVKAPISRRGFDLPEHPDFHPRTLIWWENWRTSPLSETFGSTDWDYLLETALLHSALWFGASSVAAELRLRVAKFGATPEDRLRLRLEITNPENDSIEETTAKPSTKKTAKKSDRRERLTDLKIVPPLVS